MSAWKDLQLLGRLGMLLTVPIVLAAGPLVGVLVGHWLDRRWHTAPGALVLGAAVGGIGSGIEVYRILRWVARAGRHSVGNS
ncbi:MAG: AtpZ/AtpI family protein [Candidatus Omnitrophica bacterium]|nr:AtpZ/AtpI family protein [Candidatus Omnitrophota bacterium]